MAMAMELCDTGKAQDHDIWKRGGKPSTEAMIHCFTLSKDNSMLTVDEIEMQEFQRCLLFFVAEIFKYKPSAKYDVLPFEKKLDMVLEWAVKLDAKKKMRKIGGSTTIDSAKYRKMDTLRAKAHLVTTPETPKDGSLFFNNQNSMAHYHTMSDPHMAPSVGGGSRWGDTDDEHESGGTTPNIAFSHSRNNSSIGSWHKDEVHDVDLDLSSLSVPKKSRSIGK